MGWLAGMRGKLGDFSGAREVEEEILEASRRILGAEHPDTLVAMHNLASTLGQTGDSTGARVLLEHVVAAEARVRGVDARPTTLNEALSLLELARIHRGAGRLEQADALFLATLDALEAQARRFDLSEDAKTRFRSRNRAAYRETIALFLRRDLADHAFNVLERYRAQSLLTLMHWGSSHTDKELPPSWKPSVRRSSRATPA